VAPGEEPPARPAGHRGKERALGGAMGKELFFSLLGFSFHDFNSDACIVTSADNCVVGKCE